MTSRQIVNLKILEIINNILKNKDVQDLDLRFMQILDNFGMVPYGEADDRFYEEPEETLKRIKHSFLYINYAEEYKN